MIVRKGTVARFLGFLLLIGLLAGYLVGRWPAYRRQLEPPPPPQEPAFSSFPSSEDRWATWTLARSREEAASVARWQAMAEDARLPAAARQAAAARLVDRLRVMDREERAQAVLAADGVPDAAVSIQDGRVEVWVAGPVTEAEAARVGTAVARAVGLPLTAVRIRGW